MGVGRGRSAKEGTKTRTITLSMFRLWGCFVQKNIEGVVMKEVIGTRRGGEKESEVVVDCLLMYRGFACCRLAEDRIEKNKRKREMLLQSG